MEMWTPCLDTEIESDDMEVDASCADAETATNLLQRFHSPPRVPQLRVHNDFHNNNNNDPIYKERNKMSSDLHISV